MKFVISTSFSTVDHLTQLAPVADQCGWDAMSFSDHVVHPKQISTPYPYTENGERRWQAVADPVLRATLAAFPRQALHATRLAFTHPATRTPMVVEAGLPSDMAALAAGAGLTNAREGASIE